MANLQAKPTTNLLHTFDPLLHHNSQTLKSLQEVPQVTKVFSSLSAANDAISHAHPQIPKLNLSNAFLHTTPLAQLLSN